MTVFEPSDYDGHSQVFSTLALPGGDRVFGTSTHFLLHRHGKRFDNLIIGKGKYLLSMDRDQEGRLYVGGNSMIGVILPGKKGRYRFHSLDVGAELDNKKIWNTFCDGNGGVYFNAQDRSLFYYDRDTIRVIRPETRFYRLHHPSGRPVIEDVDTGLFALSGLEKRYLPRSDSLVQGRSIVSILPAVGDSATWAVFTAAHGIYRYDPSTGKVDRMSGGDGGSSLSMLREAKAYTATRLDPASNPYGAAYAAGTRLNGILLFDGNGELLLHLDGSDGLPAPYVWDLDTDPWGNLWATTNNGIALIHTGIPFTFSEKGKLFKGTITDIERSRKIGPEENREHGPLFLATEQGAWVWREEKGGFSKVKGTGTQCMDLYSYSSGKKPARMLIGAGSMGVLSTSGYPEQSSGLPAAKVISKKQAYSITGLRTAQGKGVLIGGEDGLQVLHPSGSGEGLWKESFSMKEVPEGIHSVASERIGKNSGLRLWAGLPSKGAVVVRTDRTLKEKRSRRFSEKDGLPAGTVKTFSIPWEEGVVIGTSEGLFRIEDGDPVPFCRYGELFCDGGRKIFRLEKGREKGEVWICDLEGGGIKHLIPAERGYSIDSLVFRSIEMLTVRGIHPSEERVWLGGSKGLVCYYPKVERDLDRPWDCSLRGVKGSEDSLLFRGSYYKNLGKWSIGGDSSIIDRVPVDEQAESMVPVLPYAKNRMAFSYSAFFPTRPKAVRYSYKLEGFDTAWSKWSKKTRKEYTNLPEGAYRFKVKARNVYQKESSTAEYRFRILPPWYRTWCAYSGYGIGAVLTLALIGGLWRRKRAADRRAKAYLQGLERANVEIRDEKKKVEEAHEEITQSIEYARKIQYALLQSRDHLSPNVPEHFILMKPQAKVSGDFYWAREHQGYLYFAAVDCTGHGVPGAFMSMLGISQLNEIMNTEEELSPGHILTELRERVVRELTGADPDHSAKDGMDAALVKIPLSKEEGVRSEEGEAKSEKGEARDGEDHLHGEGFNPHREGGDDNAYSQGEGFSPRGRNDNSEDTVRIEFAGAQNPLYVIRKGVGHDAPRTEGGTPKPFKNAADGIEVKGDPMPVGYDEYVERDFTTVSLQLRKGDMLYLFSDGYADQFGGPKGKKFRYGPFKELLLRLHERPLEGQKEELERTFEDWKAEGQQEQIDDVLVVGVRL